MALRIQNQTESQGKALAVGQWLLFATFFLEILLFAPHRSLADVYVITNRQEQSIKFSVPGLEKDAPNRTYDLPAGETMALQGLGQMPIYYQSDVGPIRTRIQPNSVYTFDVTTDSRLVLNQVDLGGDDTTKAGTGGVHVEKLMEVVDLPVKIVVDDDEPAQQAQWEARLRKRVEDASQVLEHCCRVRLHVVSAGTWLSDNRMNSFDQAFQEFTQLVNPDSARLVIGFTSQFPVPEKPGRVGLTSGLLHGHILMREGARRATEAEMAEALLQEIGRVLGAVNQDSKTSIMRPAMLDGQARRTDFPLQFDPVNLLLVNMLAEEIRRNDVQQLADLQPGTRARLRQIYTRLGLAPKPKADPNEIPAANVAHASRAVGDTNSKSTGSEKKPRKRTSAHPDLSRLQGQWKVVSAQRRGAAVPEVMLYKPELKDDKLTLAAENFGTLSFRMDIDPQQETTEPEKAGASAGQGDQNQVPIPFDLVMRIQEKDYIAHGIYVFDGARLRVCIARPGKPRPADFSAPADVDQALLVFERPGG